VRESVTESALGRIRLQWWRETIAAAYDGAPPRRHPIVEALTATIGAFRPAREHFDRLIDAREADLADEPLADLAILEDYAEATSSQLVHAALEILGVECSAARAAAHHAGIAYALAGMLRAMPLLLSAGRRIIPAELVRRHGLDPDDWRAWRGSPALVAAVAEITAAASAHLRAAAGVRGGIPRAALAALLPTVIARQALLRLARAGYDPFAAALRQADPWQSWRLAVAVLRRRY
jgi:NADH dehydrogenase [ubiquinone] 1 alpha subcomplex assembly factor 6